MREFGGRSELEAAPVWLVERVTQVIIAEGQVAESQRRGAEMDAKIEAMRHGR